jgi:hypothetical protein
MCSSLAIYFESSYVCAESYFDTGMLCECESQCLKTWIYALSLGVSFRSNLFAFKNLIKSADYFLGLYSRFPFTTLPKNQRILMNLSPTALRMPLLHSIKSSYYFKQFKYDLSRYIRVHPMLIN